MDITAAMVKALREKTELPMMECKNALQEAGGDEAKAIELLREKGKMKGRKMAHRAAGEGRIGIFVDPETQRAGIVELRCETAPVASTDDFIGLTEMIARHVALIEHPSVETLRSVSLLDDPSRSVGDQIDEVFNRLRENIQIGRVHQMQGEVGRYVHFDGQKGALARLSGACPEELSAGVCMHITAMKPPYLRRDEVDPAEVERQRQDFAAQAKGKPEQVVEKIVTGKLNRWFSQDVLLDQPYVKDDKKSVGQALKECAPGLTIEEFVRYEVGGV